MAAVFQYSDRQAAAFAENLIRVSSNKDANPTMHAIVHRGIDGHFAWQQGQEAQLRADLEDIFSAVGARY